MREALEKHEKYKLGEELKVGEYVDMKGKKGEWKVGQVVWKEGEKMGVSVEGAAEVAEEIVTLSSPYLAPFRKHTTTSSVFKVKIELKTLQMQC